MLKQKAIIATKWSGADVLLRQGIQFIVAIFLARLISPSEFGTIALLYLFVGVAGAFVDSGFSASLIQKKNITHTDESTVFWFNLVAGGVMSASLWFSARWIADFYASPILVPLTSVFALNIFISAMGSVHGTLLTRNLEFKSQIKIGAIATVVSGAVGVFMAFQGYGVWALAIQALISTTLTTIFLWMFNPWKPSLTFSFLSAERLFSFGGYLLVAGILDIAYSRIYTLLIGRFYGVAELGYFNRADSTKQMPVGVITGIISRVGVPVFSIASGDKEKLKRGMSYAVKIIMLINIPMMLGLIATAEPLVYVLFGKAWIPAVPLLKVLAFAGLLWPLHVLNLNVLMAQGHSRLFFRLEVIKKVIGIVLLGFGVSYGVMGIAWSQVAFGLIAFWINAHYTRIYLDYGPLQQVIDFLPALILSGLMAVSVYTLGLLLPWTHALNLALQVLFGVIFFVILCTVLRLESYVEVFKIFSGSFKRKQLLEAR